MEIPAKTIAICLLSICLPLSAAQSVGGLVLTFAPSSLDTCATSSNASASSGAITFTTYSVPTSVTCINLNETFLSNSSQGFTYAENNAHYTSSGNGPIGVNWTISSASQYSSTANYSYIWYQQVNASGSTGSGKAAERYIDLYPEYNCKESSDYIAQPYYGYSCQSPTDGQCNQAAYSVASFSIVEAPVEKKCFDFAKEGAASRTMSATGGLLAVGVALGWLMFI